MEGKNQVGSGLSGYTASMTHENLTPNGGIPLNKNMEGNQGPEFNSEKIVSPQVGPKKEKRTGPRKTEDSAQETLNVLKGMFTSEEQKRLQELREKFIKQDKTDNTVSTTRIDVAIGDAEKKLNTQPPQDNEQTGDPTTPAGGEERPNPNGPITPSQEGGNGEPPEPPAPPVDTGEVPPEEPDPLQVLRDALAAHGIDNEIIDRLVNGLTDKERVDRVREMFSQRDAASGEDELDILLNEFLTEIEGADINEIKAVFMQAWEEAYSDQLQKLSAYLEREMEQDRPEIENEDAKFVRLVKAWGDTSADPSVQTKMAERGIEPTDGLLIEMGYRRIDRSKKYDDLEEMVAGASPRRGGGGAEELHEKLNSAINGVDNPEDLAALAESHVKRYTFTFGKDIFDPDTGQTYQQRHQEIVTDVTPGNLEQKKADLQDLLEKVFSRHMAEGEERESLPKSMEDLTELLMKKLTAEYKVGGIRELMSPGEDGELEVNYANLAALMRKDAIFWMNWSPNDPRVNLFGTPLLEMDYRSINLGAVLFEAKQYGRKRVRRVGIDPATGRSGEYYQYVDDPKHKEFRERITNEIFHTQVTRNIGIYHNQTKESMESLNKAMGEVLPNSDLTRRDGFEALYSVPALSEGYLVGEEGRNNSRGGELIALAEKVYQQIGNLDKMQEMLGKNAPLFKQKYRKTEQGDGMLTFKEGTLEPESWLEGGGETRARDVRVTWTKDWYDENGSLKTLDIPVNVTDEEKIAILKKDWVRGQFLDYMNIFNDQLKSTEIVSEVRERIKQSLMERQLDTLRREDGSFDPEKPLYKILRERLTRAGNLNSEELKLSVEQGIMQFAYEDARLAEEIAYTFGWTGIRGMGDNTETGFSSDTKLFRTKGYRVGQSSANRKGQDIGNPKTIGIYPALLAPVYASIKTLDGDLLQIKIDKIANNFLVSNGFVATPDGYEARSSLSLAKEMKFKGDALKTWWGNFFDRSVTTYGSIATGEAMDLDKIMGWDPIKGYTIDNTAFYEMLDKKFAKPERYRVGYGDVDLDSDFESYDIVSRREVYKDENGVEHQFRIVLPKTIKMGENMYGKQVYKREFMVKIETRDGNGNIIKKVKKDEHGKTVKDAQGNIVREPVMVDTDQVDYVRANGSGAFWVEGALVRFAADIKAHRDKKDISHYWDNHKVRKFIEALEKLPADVEVNEDNMKTHATNKSFTEEQIEYLRRLAGVEAWKLDLVDGGTAVGSGIALGLFSGFRKLFSGLTK